nr:LuxR C-terminal-related transcriptional regulator [Citromicrobium bathyomarinum]
MNRDRTARASASELSRREMDVLRALATGGSDKELARELGISDHGVRFHLKGVFKKLGVHDRLSAVVRAQEKGWI